MGNEINNKQINIDTSSIELAEQMRREFTANVSHELKTPLHTIHGCAELLLAGVVKQEDVEVFLKRIYSESKRMISLVDDIINLSQLDEGSSDMKTDRINLFTVAQQTIDHLSANASLANVAFFVEGNEAIISGYPQLVERIIFNLCDNAIKYNNVNGEVRVIIEENENTVDLTVKDTGIGIPAEDLDRIFERFYRVDKSRSKEVGGTGLGLSIVKHAAILHNAQVKISSTSGEGTSITIHFPK